MKRLLFLLCILTIWIPADSSETAGSGSLKKGKIALDRGDFDSAVYCLSGAENEYPLLGDYALLWLSVAYHETGNHRDSLDTIRTLLKKYPDSPLTRKSRVREIEEVAETTGENLPQLFEAYLKDYPRDTEINFFFAQWLKKQGDQKKAIGIFREIYVDAGPLSVQAYHELHAADIGLEDTIRRAANLIKLMNYRDAEVLLRSALAGNNGSLHREILKNLGVSLFRQKKYPEAAEIYQKAQERYWEVRSLYRSGAKETIDSVINELLNSKDSRMSTILFAVAADKRRDGKIEEALNLYRRIMDRYPQEKEEALWGIGWTCYVSGDHQKAADIFATMHSTYGDPKYLYWRARSIEAEGGDASDIYPVYRGEAQNFYGMMSYIRRNDHREQMNGNLNAVRKPVKKILLSLRKNDRVEALLDLALSEEAIAEMVHLSKNASSMEDISYICSKLEELGDYKHLVRLAGKLPYREEFHRFLYPRAYWTTVDNLSGKYTIDPLLVLAIVREESRFDSEARSPAGALGLMQIMPQTAFSLNTRLKLQMHSTHDILQVKNNLHAGIYYLGNLMKEFGSFAHAVAAYNAGEDIVRKWIQKGHYKSADEFIEDIPYAETRTYVKRVLTTFFEYKRASVPDGGSLHIEREKL